MFPIAEAKSILMNMLALAGTRMLITTTIHSEAREGMMPKSMDEMNIMRFRHEYSREEIDALCIAVCEELGCWRLKYWEMTDPKLKHWTGILFWRIATDEPVAVVDPKWDIGGGWHDLL